MPAEPPFQLENIEYSAKLGLWVLVSAHDITTTNLPVGGVTTLTATGTNGLKLPTAGRPDSSYDNYIFTHLSPAASAGYFRLNFVDVFPTTPLVTQRIDPVWGLVQTHTYLALTASELPLRATEFPASSGRYVLDSTETQLSGDVCIVRVDTVASLTATQTDKLVDQETGALYTQTKTWTLATTNPTGAATGSNALFTEVKQQSFRLWLSITGPSSLVGIGYANRRTYDTQAALFWPAVMTDFQMLTVLSQITSPADGRFVRLPAYRMRDAFSDPVKCVISEWWQQTAPVWGSGGLPSPDATMQPAAINVRGNLMSLSIPECLHEAVTYQEQNAIVPGSDFDPWISIELKMVEFSWAATNYTVWPETFTKVFSQPQNGGYFCRVEVYHRPTVSGGELTVDSTSIDWVLQDHGYWYDLR